MKEFDLKKFLSKFKNNSVDFFRFPGNYGDSLIWHGTKKLLSLLNISERYVDIFSPKYNEVRNFLIKKSNLYREIVILPHTIFGGRQIEVLNNVSGNLTVFCREKVSAKFLENGLTHGKVYLWNDCAFYNKFSQVSTGKGILNAFRSDKESILKTWPESNNDLSSNGYATKPIDELIEIIQKYEQVNTDRLHIAICSTLLGKRVKLFPNSYYKNKAVFDYSLKKFPNISFIEKFSD